MQTELDRTAIRKQLRRALQPSLRPANYQKTHWPVWLEDRLTTLAIYSYSDKSKAEPVMIRCLRQFGQGYTYEVVAINLGISRASVQQYISRALTWVIANTPDNLLANIPTPDHDDSQVRSKGCKKCHGDLLYDSSEAEWWCLQCSCRQKI